MATSDPIHTIQQLLSRRSGVRLLLCEDSREVIGRLSNLTQEELAGQRLIVLSWDHWPSSAAVIDALIDQLAHVAAALWPNWYASTSIADQALGFSPTLDEIHSCLVTAARSSPQSRHVLSNWLLGAVRLCATSQLPRPAGLLTPEQEARQLLLAIGATGCTIVLDISAAVANEPLASGYQASLLWIAKGAEWLAHHTTANVVILGPASLQERSELDGINFETIEFLSSNSSSSNLGVVAPNVNPAVSTNLETPLSAKKRKPNLSTSDIADLGIREGQSTTDIPYESHISTTVSSPPQKPRIQLRVHPLVGHPHPDSQGEQLLWKMLTNDAELKDLFACNAWQATVCHTTYLVDFLWGSGRLVIEVDGYYWHSQPYQFSVDRKRDYELLRSGFLVLRLPHDEVLSSPLAALEKVRQMVRFRRQGISP